MSMFPLAISCLTASNLPWFMDVTFQVPMQYFFTAEDFPSITTTGCCFALAQPLHFFPDLFLCFSTLAYWGPTNLGGSSFSSVQFSSATQSCLTLCNPKDCSTPGLPIHHQLPESTQTHVHWVGHAIQPFHPLSSPSPPALNPSQHQSLFQWVNSLHDVAKGLELQL